MIGKPFPIRSNSPFPTAPLSHASTGSFFNSIVRVESVSEPVIGVRVISALLSIVIFKLVVIIFYILSKTSQENPPSSPSGGWIG
ncbi:MAG: hypothetical protein MRERC_1c029 [Mycoplasmataceae bacterium RC_NB112A]|nr:MAG: hypothetical protein MRERC_1c029 [Mycoplasmataceae bacterium RC_NB112A]